MENIASMKTKYVAYDLDDMLRKQNNKIIYDNCGQTYYIRMKSNLKLTQVYLYMFTFGVLDSEGHFIILLT